MAYPPTVPSGDRIATTPLPSNHSVEHNTVAAALTDIINELGANPKNGFASVTAAIADVLADVVAAEADIVTLQTDLDTAEATIVTLQSDLDAAETTIGTLTSDLNTAEAKLALLPNAIRHGRATVTTDANGLCTINFGVTFTSAPTIVGLTVERSSTSQNAAHLASAATTASISVRVTANDVILTNTSLAIHWAALGTIA